MLALIMCTDAAFKFPVKYAFQPLNDDGNDKMLDVQETIGLNTDSLDEALEVIAQKDINVKIYSQKSNYWGYITNVTDFKPFQIRQLISKVETGDLLSIKKKRQLSPKSHGDIYRFEGSVEQAEIIETREKPEVREYNPNKQERR